MTTFHELLANFEKDLAQHDNEVVAVACSVDPSAAVDDVVAGPIPEDRECTACNEVWPLDSEFFYRNKVKPDGFDTRCKACVAEARDLNKTKAVVAASVQAPTRIGTLSLFVPKGEGKSCVCCEKEFPLSSAFWLELEPGEFSGNCLSCISFASKKMSDGGLAHAR